MYYFIYIHIHIYNIDNYVTHDMSRRPLDIYPLKDGTKVFRTHRDDQSAFNFLLDKYFGRNADSIRQVHLNSYARAYWRSKISAHEAKRYIDRSNILSCPKMIM